MTCNPQWPEITSQLRPGQQYEDIPLIVCRVFKQRLVHFLKTLSTIFPSAGERQYIVHCIEFQKRGLPHCHILIKFHANCTTPDDSNSVVSAEIPVDATDAALVRKHMLHIHPPPHKPPSRYCQQETNGHRICRFGYPQPLQGETTIDGFGKVHYRRCNPSDDMVVPYCLPLLRMYQCHMNFEVASAAELFQYMFKYIHKGNTFITIVLLMLIFPSRT